MMRGFLNTMLMSTSLKTSMANSASFGLYESAAAGNDSTTENFTRITCLPARASKKVKPRTGACCPEIPVVAKFSGIYDKLCLCKNSAVIILWLDAVSISAVTKWPPTFAGMVQCKSTNGAVLMLDAAHFRSGRIADLRFDIIVQM